MIVDDDDEEEEDEDGYEIHYCGDRMVMIMLSSLFN